MTKDKSSIEDVLPDMVDAIDPHEFEDSRTESGDVSRESPKRSFVKALTWRMVGTLDTFFLSFFIIKYLGPIFGIQEASDNLDIAQTASLIAITEIITKIVIYTLHERVWNRIQWGVLSNYGGRYELRIRSVFKMSTWRVLASLDTTVIAFVFTGNIGTAISIGGLEVITKLVLYFLHERVWLRLNFGLER